MGGNHGVEMQKRVGERGRSEADEKCMEVSGVSRACSMRQAASREDGRCKIAMSPD